MYFLTSVPFLRLFHFPLFYFLRLFHFPLFYFLRLFHFLLFYFLRLFLSLCFTSLGYFTSLCFTSLVYFTSLCFTQDNLDSIQPTVKLKKLSVNPEQTPDSAHCMCFTSDSERLVTLTSSSQLQVVAIGTDRFETEFTFPSLSGDFLLWSVFRFVWMTFANYSTVMILSFRTERSEQTV